MKHVRESLSQYYDYKFFKMFEEEKEEKEEKSELQDKEQNGLAIIDKITKNFEDFKKNANGEILKYKEFWEENKQKKEAFSETGDVYKMFDSDYVVGVLELPAETLSDGSIEGGLGASEEPEEEIIEGKVLEAIEERPVEENPEEEKPEGEVEDLADINITDPAEEPQPEEPEVDQNNPIEIPELPDAGAEAPVEEPVEQTPDMSEPTQDAKLTEPQVYFVVYDTTGEEREEIFRTGSNNVVSAFKSFYNDTFKGAMKNIILQYKEQKEIQKKEAEKAEKQKAETEKQSKVKKFLGESASSPSSFEDSTEAAEYVKTNLFEITGFEEIIANPQDDEMMHPDIFEKIDNWYEENRYNITDENEEEFWSGILNWEDITNDPENPTHRGGIHHYEE